MIKPELLCLMASIIMSSEDCTHEYAVESARGIYDEFFGGSK